MWYIAVMENPPATPSSQQPRKPQSRRPDKALTGLSGVAFGVGLGGGLPGAILGGLLGWVIGDQAEKEFDEKNKK